MVRLFPYLSYTVAGSREESMTDIIYMLCQADVCKLRLFVIYMRHIVVYSLVVQALQYTECNKMKIKAERRL